MEKKCYELRLQFESRRAIKLFKDFGEKNMKKEVESFLNSFYDYYEGLSEDKKTELFKNLSYYNKEGWELIFIEPDEETLSFRNQQSIIRLTHTTPDKKSTELELVVNLDENFLKMTLPGNNLELVKIEKRDGNFSKYNPEFKKFVGFVDKVTKETKYRTITGTLFGEKTVVQDVTLKENKTQEEKE